MISTSDKVAGKGEDLLELGTPVPSSLAMVRKPIRRRVHVARQKNRTADSITPYRTGGNQYSLPGTTQPSTNRTSLPVADVSSAR